MTQAQHRHRVQVRWADSDSLGHLNHARYLSLFEDGRMALLSGSPTGLAGTPDDRGCIAARVAVDYLSPVLYRPGLALDVRTWVSRVGNTSWTLLAELSDDGQPMARCECVMVAYSYVDAKPRTLDPDERAFWSEYLEG
ncbi:MAG: thioesterase family protein [Actinocatenispora sp.]